ncbi:TPA: hypothetical protein ACUI23_002384 [Staphylococcus pseudintermedius]
MDAIDTFFCLTCPLAMICGSCCHHDFENGAPLHHQCSPIIKRAFLKSVLLSRKALMLIAY